MNQFSEKIKKIMPNKQEDPEKRYFKTIVYLTIGIILIMLIACFITFLLTIKGGEQTLVPDVNGLELENALIELDEKALIPGIKLRYSGNAFDKGTVIGQNPDPGTLVKAGTKVLLKISKGSAIEQLDDYKGWNLDDLEAHLKSMVTIYGPLLQIKRPVIKVYDESSAGTILEQKPKPGSELTSLTNLELVVSKGQFGQTVQVFDYIDLDYKEVINSVIRSNIPFSFRSRPAAAGEIPNAVVSQFPDPETEVPSGTILQFVIAEPENIPENYVFGILERTMPDYPVPVDIVLEAITPGGEIKQLYKMKHRGGLLTIPYLEMENTIIKIIVAGSETAEYFVKSYLEY